MFQINSIYKKPRHLINETFKRKHLTNGDKMEVTKQLTEEEAKKADDVTAPFIANISMEHPLEDYKKLVKSKLELDVVVEDRFIERNYKQISKAGREMVWKLLFENNTSKEPTENHEKAAKLLEAVKLDACFYDPWEYNKWIVLVRNELLRRKMLDFWRDHMVKKELGPCWARDCDFFDDLDNIEAEAFYSYGGCKAQFQAGIKRCPPCLTYENCTNDYIERFNYTVLVFQDDKEKLIEMLAEVRDFIWDLLFKEDTLSDERFKKAASLLQRFKSHSNFYHPDMYNEWIVKVRDELFKRKYFKVWTDVIIQKKCGLCCFLDSPFFEDYPNDTTAEEFLKSGDALMSKEENKTESK